MSKNYHKLKLNYKIWIETDLHVSILGEGKWKLLTAIKETGSLKAAVESMGLSYRQTWTKLKEIEEKLGFPIIEKSRGGAEGGHTSLTPQGEKIVEFFDKVYSKFEPRVKDIFSKLVQDLNTIHKPN
ncbi:MAG: LysR family transcriptional regulator [Bacteroidales bacterium]|nr:LysR family transcriptional regulator [Bacteroidales bacterium]NLM91421.1 LysR family transcriptional regulator [Bacteroidales bacterium]